jgi:NAD(P)H-hydrate epimerase
MLPRRPADSYKGKNGHVLVVAGSRGMSGAAYLTALGALRGGAGLVTAAIVEGERSVITQALPEAMTLPLPQTLDGCLSEAALPILNDYLEIRSISAVALGPGLSVHSSVAKIVKTILQTWDKPLVVDADGLNNLTAEDIGPHPPMVITPHPLELARLLEVNRDVVKEGRVMVAEKAAADHQWICVLKGRHTVVTDGRTTRINPTGNPAMATGGMGDVLTGVIAAFLAQGLPPLEASFAGVYLHGLAGDMARVSDRGMLARELANTIPQALKKIGVK